MIKTKDLGSTRGENGGREGKRVLKLYSSLQNFTPIVNVTNFTIKYGPVEFSVILK